jgi:hypothetical protein
MSTKGDDPPLLSFRVSCHFRECAQSKTCQRDTATDGTALSANIHYLHCGCCCLNKSCLRRLSKMTRRIVCPPSTTPVTRALIYTIHRFARYAKLQLSPSSPLSSSTSSITNTESSPQLSTTRFLRIIRASWSQI